MQIVIDIPKKDYDKMCKGELVDTILVAIKYGIPLPEGHGRLIDEKEIYDVVISVFDDARYSPKTFLNVIHNQCIGVVGADRTESEE